MGCWVDTRDVTAGTQKVLGKPIFQDLPPPERAVPVNVGDRALAIGAIAGDATHVQVVFRGKPVEAPVVAIPTGGPTRIGAYALWGVAFIIFAECGLFAILPGDSLLFTVGLLTATGVIPHNLAFVCIVLTIAAVLGNMSGYAIGRKIGPPLFRPRSGLAGKIFKQSYVDKTHIFLQRYGNRALILARFVPIVRTFVTLVAGVGKMNFRHFITYTAIVACSGYAG
jgi:membrane protein DedA with SNARE-associated domain